jgi:LacI family transcriptional regulator
VLIGREPLTFQADLVAMDHATGTRMAVAHLISRGHRRIAIIPGPEAQPFSRARIDGWRAALKAAGIPPAEPYIAHADYTTDGGRLAATRLVDLREPPQAILAGNFHEVVGVLGVLRQRKMTRVVEVMSSHDAPVLDVLDPPVSSVDQPVHEIGTRATELLLRRIRQPGRPYERVLLRPTLKLRTWPEDYRTQAAKQG